MTGQAQHKRISRLDRDFLARLHDLQQMNLAKAQVISPTGVVAQTPVKGPVAQQLARRRQQWDFDGSILLGRVDTPEGRFYVGMRRVLDEGSPVLYSPDDPEVQQHWASTASAPGNALLKRHLRVHRWEIVDWTSEFDLRRRPARRAPRGQERREAHEIDRRLATLDTDRKLLLRLLADASDAVQQGRATTTDLVGALTAWNEGLVEMAGTLALFDSDITLEEIRAAVDKARQARRQAAEAALRDLLERYPELVDEFDDLAHRGKRRHGPKAAGAETIACGVPL